MSPEQQETRQGHGCDAPLDGARYQILCPSCDGVGCPVCEGEDAGRRRGYKVVRRCPPSHLTSEFSDYLRRRAWRSRGEKPWPGTVDDYPLRYVQFVEEVDGEEARVREAEREEAERLAQARQRGR